MQSYANDYSFYPARAVPAGGRGFGAGFVAANCDCPILRIDTNQGVYGLGEVRDTGGGCG